jgi:hypothetical protein
VGAWGPGIFSDDTASDIRGDYRELLEDQVPDDEATQRIIESYRELDEDEKHVLWLALAATQSGLGRLDDEVKARALAVIDDGVGLQLWEEAGPKELQKRRAALSKLRAQLVGPQPARKTLRRPWRHVTDLQAGDVLAFASSSGEMALLRVHRIDDHRVGAAPIASWLDWRGTSLPDGAALARLEARPMSGPGPLGHRRLETFRVSRHRKKDPDWMDVGFSVVARLPLTAQDAETPPWTYLSWTQLTAHIERLMAP